MSELRSKLFGARVSEKEFVEIEGGHFGLLWYSSAEFDEAINRQIAFLSRVFRDD